MGVPGFNGLNCIYLGKDSIAHRAKHLIIRKEFAIDQRYALCTWSYAEDIC